MQSSRQLEELVTGTKGAKGEEGWFHFFYYAFFFFFFWSRTLAHATVSPMKGRAFPLKLSGNVLTDT